MMEDRRDWSLLRRYWTLLTKYSSLSWVKAHNFIAYYYFPSCTPARPGRGSLKLNWRDGPLFHRYLILLWKKRQR
uniref:Uncharacterized protein n=1 Tax=Anguilla anguilla TaxID=7936 RepID=A0A0E9R9S4_ANGAN